MDRQRSPGGLPAPALVHPRPRARHQGRHRSRHAPAPQRPHRRRQNKTKMIVIADLGCSPSEQDGHGAVSHISLFWVPVPGRCKRYRMILAAGLMLTLSTTKGSQEQQSRNNGVRQRPAERWCWRWLGSPAPAVVMMMMAIRGTVAQRCQAEHDAVGRGAGGTAEITSVRYHVQVWRLPFADALPGRMRDTRSCTRSAGLFPPAYAIGAETADGDSSAVGADADAAR